MRWYRFAPLPFVLLTACGEDLPEPIDASVSDAGSVDSGPAPDADPNDVSTDVGWDGSVDGNTDASPDATTDAGDDGSVSDGGSDAGPPPPATVVINELLYHPTLAQGDAEFLELYNLTAAPVALDGWRLSGFGFTFPAGTSIAPGAYLVVAGDAAAFTAAFGSAPDFSTTGNLSNSGETISLRDALDVTIDSVAYSDQLPWPVIADGDGHSLELIAPDLDNAQARYWLAGGPTPGAENSVFQAQPPPYVVAVTFPHEPSAGTMITFTAEVDDATSADLITRIDFDAPATIAMTPGPGGTFLGELTAPSAGSLVRFRIEAHGPTGDATWPRAGDSVTWDGTVVADPSVVTMLPLFQWFMDPANYSLALSHRYDDTLEPAVFYFDGVLYSDIQVRIKGDSARDYDKTHWKFKLPRGHDFNEPGLVPIALDQFNLQSSYADKSYVRDLIAYQTLHDAGMPWNAAFHVRLHRNGAFHGLYTFVQDMDGEYLRSNGLSDQGAWYEASNGDGSPAGAGSIEYLYEKANRDTESYSDLSDLLSGFALPGLARRAYLYDNIVVASFINYLAVNVIIHNNDQITKNYFLHRDTIGDQRWSIQAWDMDLTFGRNYTDNVVLNDVIWADDDLPDPLRPEVSPSHPLYGDEAHQKWDNQWNRIIAAFHDDADLRAMFYRRLRTLMDQLFADDHYEQWIALEDLKIGPEVVLDRAAWAPWGQALDLAAATNQIVIDFLPRRRTHLFTTHRTPSEIPPAQSSTASVVINELHYRPNNGANLEFVELYNPSTIEAVDISGWSIPGLLLTIPAGTVILPDQYLVLVKDDVLFRGTRGGGRFIAATYVDSLNDSGEAIQLVDRGGNVVDAVTYSAFAPWPTAPNGTGPSLELVSAGSDHGLPGSWSASQVAEGTPGAKNSVSP